MLRGGGLGAFDSIRAKTKTFSENVDMRKVSEGRRTFDPASRIANTNSRLAPLRLRIVSVRPWRKRRVVAVSYVAVKELRDLCHASWRAIWMYASGERPAIDV